MKKWLLLIISIFLITGCKVEYNVTINDDLNVLESVNMTGDEEFFNIYYKTLRINVVKMMLASNDNEDKLKNNNYDYKIVDNGNYPYVLASKNYNNLSDYVNSSIFFIQYFDNVTFNEDNGIITFKATEFKPNNNDDPSRYNIKNTQINITSKYKVVENNANTVNKKSNIYSWNINSNTDNLEILLSFDTNKQFKYVNYDLIIAIVLVVSIIVASWLFLFYKKK